MANTNYGLPSAYNNSLTGPVTPDWLNKGDNAWQMTAATLVGMQSVPGLVILYGSIVKKKWAVNSAFMAFYAFAVTLVCWVLWAYKMSFGHKLIPFWGKAGGALSHKYMLQQSILPASAYNYSTMYGVSSSLAPFAGEAAKQYFPMATMVYFQFVFAAITVILVAGSLLGRMNWFAWVLFVPLWITFSYTVGAFSLFGGGFLSHLGVLDYSGGYVIHLSSGVAGFTAAFWVGPRLMRDRQSFPPNNLLLMLAGAGMLWLGWTGFNGGDPYAANIDSSIAVINTHVCTATSLLVWIALDVWHSGKPSVIGAVQGMVTGLVAITPAAGLIEGWAAIIFGLLSGSVPWFTMMIVHKKLWFLRNIDDTMAVFHTHAVAGTMGGILTGLFGEPDLLSLYGGPLQLQYGLFYKYNGSFKRGGYQVAVQIIGALFIIGWNVLVTSIICNAIGLFVPLRLTEEQLETGDDAVHGEEAYALFGDGMKGDTEHSHSKGAYYDSGDPKPLVEEAELQKMPLGADMMTDEI